MTRVGHNFPKNPVHDLAKEMIDSGEIGDIVLFRASMHVDVLADPNTPFMWRCDGNLAPTGVVGDVASHLFSFVHRLIGPIEELAAEYAIELLNVPTAKVLVTEYRPRRNRAQLSARSQIPTSSTSCASSAMVAAASSMLSRVASGRRFLQKYEVYGTRGGLEFNYDEINRPALLLMDDAPNRQGYRLIDVGPENANFASLLPVANFGLGYNEYKAIEVSEVVEVGRNRQTRLAHLQRRV